MQEAGFGVGQNSGVDAEELKRTPLLEKECVYSR